MVRHQLKDQETRSGVYIIIISSKSLNHCCRNFCNQFGYSSELIKKEPIW
uniref:Uncharacterized protein n=1 Tax=Rhizophora mucronata TaxID=61149 RepID=A0A2P2P4H2_RHIMU